MKCFRNESWPVFKKISVCSFQEILDSGNYFTVFLYYTETIITSRNPESLI
jgi:hypothetical protein